MSIPLTLGVPHRPDPLALTTGLLSRRVHTGDALLDLTDGVVFGPPVVAASVLTGLAAAIDLGTVVVDLDIDPDDLRGREGPRYVAARYDVDASADDLHEAIALRLPSPLVIFPRLHELTPGDEPRGDTAAVDAATALVEAHRTPGFRADDSARRIADFLAVVAHSDVGFVARASNGREVVAILAATVAALRGDDIPGALARPNVAAMRALVPEAAEAVREVLLGIEIDDADAGPARDHLVETGLAPASEPTT